MADDRAVAAARRREKEIVRFLRDMVAIPGESCQEEAIIQRIAREMEDLGFDEVRVDKMGNVIGRVGSGPRKIVFDSHVDTVGIGDREAWPHDPYEGKIEDGVIYGRGAGDDRGSTACQVYGAALAKELGTVNDDTSVYVVGTVMEEDCDGLALQYILENEIPDAAGVVIGESTDLQVYRGHRGRVEFAIETTGKACHASAPERGENAIYKMQPIISGIEKLNDRLKADPFLGKGTIVVSKVECTTPSLNAVPDRCRIYIDRRLTAGETIESALEEIRSIPEAEEASIQILKYARPSYTGFVFETDKYFPSWVLPEDHPIVQSGISAARTVLGKDPVVDKWTFSTNGIASMGRLDIPTVGFGPSKEKWAHTVEDQCPVDDLVICAAFYATFPDAYARIHREN